MSEEQQAAPPAGGPMNLIPKLPVQPIPTFIELGGAASPDGQKYVVMAFSTPIGVSVFHVSVDAIDSFAEGILEAKRALGPAGLIVPELSPESMRKINDEVLGRGPAKEGTRP